MQACSGGTFTRQLATSARALRCCSRDPALGTCLRAAGQFDGLGFMAGYVPSAFNPCAACENDRCGGRKHRVPHRASRSVSTLSPSLLCPTSRKTLSATGVARGAMATMRTGFPYVSRRRYATGCCHRALRPGQNANRATLGSTRTQSLRTRRTRIQAPHLTRRAR